MIEIGRHNTLPVLRIEDRGALLGSEDQWAILPRREIAEDLEPGHTLRVFVYTVGDGVLMATTLEPLAAVGDFAYLQVVDVNEHGAFVDWGLPKDLFVPFGNQYAPMEKGASYVVGVRVHHRTQRVVGASVLAGMFDDDISRLSPGDKVDLLVYGYNEHGIQVIVNRRHAGLVYHDQTFARLKPGDELEGWVSVVRDDHRLDISMQRPGRGGVDDACTRILAALDAAGGELPLHDKSRPESISRALQMSKKVFKQAVGRLYRNRRIELIEGGIRKLG